MDAGNMIKPMLARGELRLIGATTLDEYRQYIEKDAALERRFQQVFVPPPSVADTIAILRGLKERYEVHHGVRIQDAALVAAAVLSDRYVTGRFLPDKAIDLMDEAASRLRIEIDSMPTELDVVTRRLRQLEIERMALAKETDPASADRLARLDEEMANLTEESSAMTAHWQAEKEAISTIQSLKTQLEQARCDAERLGREGDLAAASEITYGVVPDLERQVEEATAALDDLQRDQRFLKEEVDAEDVAEVVSRATGVPVSRLLEGEVEKLVRMEDALHARVVGQDEAVSAVSNAIRRSRAGLSEPGPADRLVPLHGADRRGQDRTRPGPGRVPLRRRQGHGPDRHERVHGAPLGGPARRGALPATSATRRAASSPRPSVAVPTRWCCSTSSRRRTPTSSTRCSRCWRTVG